MLIIVIGCNSENPTFEYHPIVERIPYSSREDLILDINKNSDTSAETGRLIESLSNSSVLFIEKSESTLELLFDFQSSVFKSLNESRILILDTRKQVIYEYNLTDEKLSVLAEQGRGPSEIRFVNDIVIDGDKLLTVNSIGEYKVYDCSNTPCYYSKTYINEDIRPYSASIDNDRILIMGYSEEDAINRKNNEKVASLHWLDSDRVVDYSFGDLYDIRGEWMLLRPFTSGGVNHLTDNMVVQYFRMFPYIYIYENEEISKIYNVTNFLLSKLQFNNQSRSLRVNLDNWSSIRHLQVLDESRFIIEVANRIKVREGKQLGDIDWKTIHDYYLINYEKDYSYYLGNNDQENSLIKITSNHLIENRGDSLLVYNYKIEKR
ncbi:hypothetical protein IQ255_29345 [Pleurocapsales cyanobacterium LEGE 10410]|nr:hypothetical protein [Pleurocapsales cyanobacterium LEGE 10410]